MKILKPLLAIAVIVTAFTIMKYMASLKELPPQKKPPETVRFVNTIKVAYQDAPATITASGRVKSNETRVVISEVSGTLASPANSLKAGRTFKKGEVLFTINNSEVRLLLKAKKVSSCELLLQSFLI